MGSGRSGASFRSWTRFHLATEANVRLPFQFPPGGWPRWRAFWRPRAVRRRPVSSGRRGERIAERYLRRRGMAIVARNQKQMRAEIDLVAVERQRTVVFVEVKTRSGQPWDHPVEAVTADKQRRIAQAALGYLKRNHLLEYPVRFDVVAVLLPAGRGRPRVQHFPGAFEPEGPAGDWG